MNKLVCEDCGSIFYSAAARTMEEEGVRCEVCGGRLVWVRPERSDEEAGVGGEAPQNGSNGPDT